MGEIGLSIWSPFFFGLLSGSRRKQDHFRGKSKISHRYHSSKNKKIRDMVDSRVQWVWRLPVMGSCVIRADEACIPKREKRHLSFSEAWNS